MPTPARTAATAAALFFTAALSVGSARADQENDAEEPVVAPRVVQPVPQLPAAAGERTWYGWQIILADAASFLCVGATEKEACLGGYALSGPVIHTLHGRPRRGLLSLGLRVALPLVGGAIGASMANCHDSPPVTTTREVDGGTITTTTSGGDFLCGLEEMGLGVMAGAGAAMIADSIMAFSERAPETAPEAPRSSGFAIAPRLAVGQNKVAMGLSGTF